MSSHTSADSTGTGVSVVYVTVPSQRNVAKNLAGSIINNKLAACVNILPGVLLLAQFLQQSLESVRSSSCMFCLLLSGVTSVYHWEGKLEEDQEQLLIIKTQTALIEELTKHVQCNHPYDECEVISLPVTGGSSSYLSWVVASATGMQ